MADEGSDCKRVTVSEEELLLLDKEALMKLWIKQDKFFAYLEQKHLSEVKELESKLMNALHDVTRKEDLMMIRLSAKEQELQDYMSQINEMKSSSANSALRPLLLDPAVNFVIEKLKRELSDTKAKLEETQSELSAWKFTPDSQTGKRLMAKCRLLHQENEDLGKVVASGKLAKLETELALQRNLADEMKKSQSEMDEFVQELDEDVEGMQSTILYLQQQLREAKGAQPAAPATNGLPLVQEEPEPPPPPPPASAPPTASDHNGYDEPARTRVSGGDEPPAEQAVRTEDEPAAELERTSPEPQARRRRRRPTEPSPEPRTKRRLGTADDSPARRLKRTRSSEDNGVPAE